MTETLRFQLENAQRIVSAPRLPKPVIPSTRNKAENRRIKATPKTDFGRRMLEFRRAIEDSDEKLLTMDEIADEVRERRGEGI